MALALERELDKQLRDLEGGPGGMEGLSPPRHSPLIIYDSDEDTPNYESRIKDEMKSESDESGQGRNEEEVEDDLSIGECNLYVCGLRVRSDRAINCTLAKIYFIK